MYSSAQFRVQSTALTPREPSPMGQTGAPFGRMSPRLWINPQPYSMSSKHIELPQSVEALLHSTLSTFKLNSPRKLGIVTQLPSVERSPLLRLLSPSEAKPPDSPMLQRCAQTAKATTAPPSRESTPQRELLFQRLWQLESEGERKPNSVLQRFMDSKNEEIVKSLRHRRRKVERKASIGRFEFQTERKKPPRMNVGASPPSLERGMTTSLKFQGGLSSMKASGRMSVCFISPRGKAEKGEGPRPRVAWVDDPSSPLRKPKGEGPSRSLQRAAVGRSMKKLQNEATVAEKRRLYQEKLRQGLTIEFKDIDVDLLLAEVTSKINQFLEQNRNFKRLLATVEALTERLLNLHKPLMSALRKNFDDIAARGTVPPSLFRQVIKPRSSNDEKERAALQELTPKLTEELSQFSVNLSEYLLRGRIDNIQHTMSKMEDYNEKLTQRALRLLARTGIKDVKKVDFILSLAQPKMPRFSAGHVVADLENMPMSSVGVLNADARATHYALEDALHKCRELEARNSAHIALFQKMN